MWPVRGRLWAETPLPCQGMVERDDIRSTTPVQTPHVQSVLCTDCSNPIIFCQRSYSTHPSSV